MALPGQFYIKKFNKFYKSHFESRGIILMYHRVTNLDCDPWQLAVSPQNFKEQMEVIQKLGTALKLQDFAAFQSGGKRLNKKIAVTFDDGYADNYIYAKPILEQFETPATIFVSSSYIGKDTEYWWDDLERIFLQPGTLPENLLIQIGGKDFSFDLKGNSHYTQEDLKSNRSWLYWEKTPSIRHHIYYVLWDALSVLSDVERDQSLAELVSWAGISKQGRQANLPLKVEEMQKIVKGGLIDIGGHTVSHPKLSTKSIEVQKQEILQNKIFLDEVLEKPVKTFSYPFGDYLPETIPLVKNSGYVGACTTAQDIVRRKTCAYEMPRFEVINWDGEEFERKLHKWLYKIK